MDVHFPKAETIRVVLDNRNTHVFGALYEAFTPEEARRIARRLEFHYTPKHGSWLNLAEMEFSVLSRQCLDRRIATAQELADAIAAWERERNEAGPRSSGRSASPTPAGNSTGFILHNFRRRPLVYHSRVILSSKFSSTLSTGCGKSFGSQAGRRSCASQ